MLEKNEILESTIKVLGLSYNYTMDVGNVDRTSWKLDYGSFQTREQVPVRNQLVFKWCDINAFGERISDDDRRIYDVVTKVKKTRKHILKNVSGVARPGELLVIMGSSGAGKTTLLNCMTFRNIKSLEVTGVICINDKPVTQKQLTAQSAYVQQDELFISWLTVKEHLIFQALVRMNSYYTHEDKIKRVDEVLGELSLSKCQHSQIGEPGITKGISGGERKRLSLAAELLTNPSILFCDEPTSGLDSFMSLNVVQILKALAETGRTVICTLHQPSSELYQIFDKICLLAEGRIAFLGNTIEAEDFFRTIHAPCPANFNPADYYIQLLSIIPGREESCQQAVKSICDAFECSTLGENLKRETLAPERSAQKHVWSTSDFLVNPYRVSWFTQFRAVSWRCWLAVMRNPRITKVRFYQVLLVALIISVIFLRQKYDQLGIQNINGALFLLITNSTFQNLTGVILTFCGELPIFLREHKNGMYRTDVYFLAKMLADFPTFTAFNIMFVTICYNCIGLNLEFPRIFIAIGIMLLVTYAVMSAGYLLSTIASNVATANSLITIVLMPFLVFGGFFFSLKSIPSYLKWLSDLSWFKYGNSALLINQWYGVTNITCNDSMTDCLKDGQHVLEYVGVEPADFWIYILGLIGTIMLFRTLAFLTLLYKTYHMA